MQFRFIDRKKDLEYLNMRYQGESFQFIIIHGRRRVGKTALIKEFISDKKGLYYMADSATEKTLLDRLYAGISFQLEGRRLKFNDLDAFFDYIYEQTLKDRYVLILDEFQYLMEVIPSFTSILQRFIDQKLNQTKLFLIICGSEIRIMQSLFGVQNPLHGRRTGQWKVKPFRFSILTQFFPGNDIQNLIEIYSFMGGIPMYLNQYDTKINLDENMKKTMLEKGSLLEEEPIHLLRQEFREIPRYFGILLAISQGKNRIVEISNSIGVEARTLPKYLTNLIETDLIEKFTPLGVNISTNKLSRYRIKDNLINFWFRFISPNQDLLQLGNVKSVIKHINLNYHDYMGSIFENIVKQLIEDLNVKELLPINLLTIGTWWKKGVEFDLIGLSIPGEEIICVEIKYGDNINGKSIIKELDNKLNATLWKDKKKYIAVVARGFSEKCEGCISINTLWLSYLNDNRLEFYESRK